MLYVMHKTAEKITLVFFSY